MLFLMGHPSARTEEEPVDKRVPFAFVEFAFGISIVVVLTSLRLTHLAVKYTTTREYRDEVFAYSAAKSILFELHALANGADLEESFDTYVTDFHARTLRRQDSHKPQGCGAAP